jgi:hypothetical protein
MKNTGIIFAFALGCSTFVVAGEIKPRAAAAQNVARKWEQFCTYRSGQADEVSAKMNPDLKQKGLEGWELTTVTITETTTPRVAYYCFKRALP